MRNELNHLLEYYSVLRKSAEMLFGERGEVAFDDPQMKRPSLGSLAPSMTESVEDLLIHHRGQDDGSGSDGSDDQLFDGKYIIPPSDRDLLYLAKREEQYQSQRSF